MGLGGSLWDWDPVEGSLGRGNVCRDPLLVRRRESSSSLTPHVTVRGVGKHAVSVCPRIFRNVACSTDSRQTVETGVSILRVRSRHGTSMARHRSCVRGTIPPFV